MAFPQIGLEAVLKIQDFERNAARYNRTLDEMDKKTKRTSDAINKSTRTAGNSAFDLQKQFREAAGGVDAASRQSIGAIQRLNTSFDQLTKTSASVAGGIGAATAAVKQILDLAEASAAIQDARESFVALAASSGISAQQLLTDLRSVSRGTVDTATLIKTANSALLAGGAQIADQLPQLYQIAEASARATGQNTDYVFSTLIRGIIKASPLLIDNAEVYIKVGDAVDKFAESQGKATDELTQQERQLATLNAVLSEGGDFVDKAGGAAARATDPFRQLKVVFGDLKQGVGELIQPLAVRLAGGIERLILIEKTFIANSIAFKAVFDERAKIFSFQANALDTYRTKFDETFQQLSGAVPAAEQAAVAIEDIGEAAGESSKELDELNEKLADLATQRGERLAKITLQNARRDEDIATQHARQLEDADRNLGRKREDMERANANARERIARDNAKRLVDVEKENQRKQRDFARDVQREREDLERTHRENLFQINQDAQDTIGEAARRNDAVAIAQALRQKQREIRDEQRNKQIEKADLQRDLTEKQQRLDEDAALSLEKARQQAVQALADQQASEAEQEASLKLFLQRQDEDRKLSWDRQNEDLVKARARTMEDLDIWYEKEQAKLKENLKALTDIATNALSTAGTQIAAASTAAIQQVAGSSYGLSRDEQYRERGNFLGSETTPAAPVYDYDDAWRRRHEFFRAEGGVDVVDRPTRFVAGEAGPELAAFIPLRNTQHTLDVSGNIGFDNLPGGVTVEQATAIVNQTLLRLARRLVVR